MVEIAFYQLRRTPLETALPKLLEKVLESDRRALVLAASEERAEALNAALWTYDRGSFLPHGTARDGRPERQPILLATDDATANGATPNGAHVAVMVDGVAPADPGRFERCLDIFDGSDAAALKAARARWRAHRDRGDTVTYWEQTQSGSWERRA